MFTTIVGSSWQLRNVLWNQFLLSLNQCLIKLRAIINNVLSFRVISRSGQSLTFRAHCLLKICKKCRQFCCTGLLRSRNLVHLDGKYLASFTWHCMKSVRIRSFPGSYFPTFGLNTERFRALSCTEITGAQNQSICSNEKWVKTLMLSVIRYVNIVKILQWSRFWRQYLKYNSFLCYV